MTEGENAGIPMIHRKDIILKDLSDPDFLDFSLPETHHFLVVHDGSGVSGEVVKRLNKISKVLVLNLFNNPHPASDENTITLMDYNEEAVFKATQKIQSRFGKIGGLIYIHPQSIPEGKHLSLQIQEELKLVKVLFFLAKYLYQDLNELGEKQRAAFLAVTRMDGHLGRGKRNHISATAGGIAGLIKSLNQEWSPVFCRMIDLDPTLSDADSAFQIMKELHDPKVGIVEVAISHQGRKTTHLTQLPIIENKNIESAITSDSVFLVSGGGRGITASCVIEMAKNFPCKFILVGRSSLDIEVPEFARDEVSEGDLKRFLMQWLLEKGEKPSVEKVQQFFTEITAVKEITRTMQQVKSFGNKVAYLEGDVTNLENVKGSLDELTKGFGPITGIIHGAGQLADKYIQDKTEADFERVIGVKLFGLLNLLEAVDPNQLQHLILFSSVAGYYGNIGQTDYAIANQMLDRLADGFKTMYPDLHVTSLIWGAWDSGMVSEELKAQWETFGVSLVNSETGSAMLVNTFHEGYKDQTEVLIGDTLPMARSFIGPLHVHQIQRRITLEDNPFLMHHMIQDNPVLPLASAISWMAHSCEQLYPDFRVFEVNDINLFKGIVFDGSLPDTFSIELKEVEKTENLIIFDSTIWSSGTKFPRKHYQATITLRHRHFMLELPKHETQINAKFTAIEKIDFYKDGSLFHGPFYQGIMKVLDLTAKQIVFIGKAPFVSERDQGQFPKTTVNSFFLDLLYQGMVIWVQKYMDGVKSLPLQTKSIKIYQEIPFDQKLIVHLNIFKNSEHKAISEGWVYDQDNKLIMHVQGAAVTISEQLVW